MTDSDWNKLSKWGEALIQHKDGRIPICFGLAATLYFLNGHTEEKRRAVLDCCNEYERICGASLRWYYASADSSRMYSVGKLRDRDMSPYLLSSMWNEPEAREHAWAFYWHAGEQPDDASHFKIDAYGGSKMDAEQGDSLSFLQVSFPVMWFQGKPEGFPDLILRWSERLRPYHGYGGITLIESPDEGLSQNYSKQIAAFAARYPGIEIDRPENHSLVIQDVIKGVNWLTILSTDFVERVGGNNALREQLGEPFVIKDYNGCVMIIAGSVPEVGDRNRNVDTPNYRKLAHVLKPIRIQDHPPPYAEGRFSEEGEYTSWLNRFDEA